MTASAVKFRWTGDGELTSYDGCLRSIRHRKASRQLEQREDCSNILSKTTRES
ncbi:hypothetical protein [Okeania sp. SIO3B5]|uniref:hypothetical protein n=1 Tax=Okeania sp. SIO3B5 TaxID=2607811 RepID=UPI0025EDF1A2|nr:hypothetical protein [Okeania sp. SIO3B5]